MVPESVAKIIIAAHVLAGSDNNSGFFGHGKNSLMKRLMADPEACELLQHVGESLDLEDGVKNYMKEFVLAKHYGGNVSITCGQARDAKWLKQNKQNKKVQYLFHQMKTPWVII